MEGCVSCGRSAIMSYSREFEEGEERKLILCPKCKADLQPFIFNITPEIIISDGDTPTRYEAPAINYAKIYEMDRAFEYVAKNSSKNGGEDTLEVCIISDLLRIIRNHNM